jgi:hypothetical protein
VASRQRPAGFFGARAITANLSGNISELRHKRAGAADRLRSPSGPRAPQTEARSNDVKNKPGRSSGKRRAQHVNVTKSIADLIRKIQPDKKRRANGCQPEAKLIDVNVMLYGAHAQTESGRPAIRSI